MSRPGIGLEETVPARYGVHVASLLHRAPMTHHLRHPLLRALGRTGMFHVTRRLASGLLLALDVEDSLMLQIYRTGTWEEHQLARIKKLMRPADVMVEAGAHCGLYATSVAHEVRESFVLAIEPNPRLRGLCELTRAINGLDNLQIDSHAISDCAGPVSFYLSSGATDGLSGLRPRVRATRRVTFESVTLPSLLDQYGVLKARVLKMDIEGAEALVLPGCVEMFRTGMVDTIFLEFHIELYESYGSSSAEIIGWLEKGGFHLFRYENDRVLPLETDWPRHITRRDMIHLLGLHDHALAELKDKLDIGA